MSDIILQLKNISKKYPGVQALDNVSIDFIRGEIHAIVGENGAGKSTLIKTVTGAIEPTSGTMIFNGVEYKSLNPSLSKHLGIGVIYQEFNNYAGLSVAENICLFEENKKRKAVVNFKEINKKTIELGEKIGVRLDPKELVGEIPVGIQQIVEIAHAIADNVSLLIMDEPSAPLTNNEVEKMFNVMRTLKEQGVTIIYISHRMEEIFEISDRVSVLCDGRYIGTKNTKETNKNELIKMMIGRELSQEYPQRTQELGEVILTAENLTGNGVENISFELHKGEILGFAGLLGCGRTETMELLMGVKRLKSGTITIKGKKTKIRNTRKAYKCGMAIIPEDRKRYGGVMHMSIAWNMTLSCLVKLSRLLVVNRKKEKETVNQYVDRIAIKTPSLEQALQNLSGGNQQKVIVAKSLAADADILIFDEPTRGIDVSAKAEIYDLMRELVNSGKSILMVSSEMPEVLGMSDRIVILSEGKMTKTISKEEATQELVLKYASNE